MNAQNPARKNREIRSSLVKCISTIKSPSSVMKCLVWWRLNGPMSVGFSTTDKHKRTSNILTWCGVHLPCCEIYTKTVCLKIRLFLIQLKMPIFYNRKSIKRKQKGSVSSFKKKETQLKTQTSPLALNMLRHAWNTTQKPEMEEEKLLTV